MQKNGVEIEGLDKYNVGFYRGNDLKILRSFDGKDEALEFGNTYFETYRKKQNKGVLVCVYREPKNNRFFENFVDKEVNTWFDTDAYLEFDRKRAEARAARKAIYAKAQSADY